MYYVLSTTLGIFKASLQFFELANFFCNIVKYGSYSSRDNNKKKYFKFYWKNELCEVI